MHCTNTAGSPPDAGIACSPAGSIAPAKPAGGSSLTAEATMEQIRAVQGALAFLASFIALYAETMGQDEEHGPPPAAGENPGLH
jgi:hypothetical protein